MPTETEELTLGDVTVTDIGPSARKLTIEVPADVVAGRIEESFTTLASAAPLPGFRPGKAPRKLIERRFGKGLREEARNQLVRDAYTKAIAQKELKVIGNPIIKDAEKIELTPGSPLRFDVEVEIVPTFELPPVDGFAIDRPQLEVTDAMVDIEINRNCERHGRLEPVESDAGPGDLFLGRVALLDEEGKSVAELPRGAARYPDADAEEGRGAIGGISVPHLDQTLKGKRAGEEITVTTTGPENHEIESIRGKPVTIRLNVEQVAKLIPAPVAALVEKFGLPGEKELREQIKLAINTQVEQEQRDAMRRQVIRHFVDQVKMDLPERASAIQAARALDNLRLRLLQRGVPAVTIEERMAEFRAATSEQARADLRTTFAMEGLAEHFEVQVTDPEINNRIALIARRQGARPDKVRSELIQRGLVGNLVAQIRHEKAADHLIARGKVTDISIEDWNRKVRDAKGGLDAEDEHGHGHDHSGHDHDHDHDEDSAKSSKSKSKPPKKSSSSPSSAPKKSPKSKG